jgi:hypothetical protein
MNKTKNRKNRKNRKKTRRTRGGEPEVITVEGLYTTTKSRNNELIAYHILRNKMNEAQKKDYADKYQVYIPPKSFLTQISKLFDIKPERLKMIFNQHFYPKIGRRNTIKQEIKTVVIRDADDIEEIEIAQKITENLENATHSTSAIRFNDTFTNEYDPATNNKQQIIDEYKNFVDDSTNQRILLTGVVDRIKGKKMLRSPVFLKIIGIKGGIFTDATWTDFVKNGLDNVYNMLNTTP